MDGKKKKKKKISPRGTDKSCRALFYGRGEITKLQEKNGLLKVVL